jgi:hypothetical protein
MKLGEVTLTFNGKSMQLIFNIAIDRTQRDRRIVVDGLPFQVGTFELDLSGWTREPESMIPATRWKKLK